MPKDFHRKHRDSIKRANNADAALNSHKEKIPKSKEKSFIALLDFLIVRKGTQEAALKFCGINDKGFFTKINEGRGLSTDHAKKILEGYSKEKEGK